MKYLGIWRNLDFVKLWFAETISQLGTQVTFLGLPLVTILVLKATALEVALLQTVAFLPYILISLPVGVWVDRHHRRPTLIISDVGRAVLLLSIPVAFALRVLSLWQLYIVIFLGGILDVFFDVAHQSYLPSLIDQDQLVQGNSALEISRSGTRVAGSSIAGILIALLTAPIAIVVDMLSYIGSAILLLLIQRRESPPVSSKDEKNQAPHFFREVGDGLHSVLNHRFLRAFAIFSAIMNLGWSMIEGVFLVYAVRYLGLSVASIGVVFTISNIGLLLGASLAGSISRYAGIGRTIAVSCILQSIGILLLPLASTAKPFPFLIAGLLMRSCGLVIYSVNQISLRQAITPTQVLGRVNATMRFISWSAIPLGPILSGTLVIFIGLKPTLWIGAIVCILAVLAVILSPIWTLRTIPQSDASPLST